MPAPAPETAAESFLHRLSDQISVISANAEHLRRDGLVTPEGAAALADILEAAERCQVLFGELRRVI